MADVETEIEFAIPLSNADVVREIAARLRSVPGIIAVRGDEHSVSVLYDTDQTTPGRIHEAFSQLGYAPREAGTEVQTETSSD